MEAKNVLESKSIWYAVISALGVLVTFLMADETTSTLIGGTGLMVLYVIDKGIQLYLRGVTKQPVTVRLNPENNLDVLDEPSQSDDDYTKDF